jgi:hypothetical protein
MVPGLRELMVCAERGQMLNSYCSIRELGTRHKEICF